MTSTPSLAQHNRISLEKEHHVYLLHSRPRGPDTKPPYSGNVAKHSSILLRSASLPALRLLLQLCGSGKQ